MRQVLAFAAAILVGSTMIAATADAQTPGGYYVATPAAQPAKSTLVTRSTAWSLRGADYVAARAPERDAVLCQLIARKTGQLSGFTVAGKAYDADQLAKCNGARGVGSASVAAR
ncbi:MAG: hypothetical protein JWN21_942 [Sphingomonas bacterium]|uniref:CC_3452 family protein n=1 Tax=Sphingomonas bacterium TaxID=1895847 RepID=UPI00262C8F9E|nr:hypothetical protein [Sphingomonas bacterium]MDB5695399.1 hypothetical protein [Sphingomonas bacterium]